MKQGLPKTGYAAAMLIGGVIMVTVLIVTIFGATKRMDERREQAETSRILNDVAKICLAKYPARNDGDVFDSLRHCVFKNSIFSDKKENTPFWDDKALMARWTRDFTTGVRQDPPPMECSFRTHTLKIMLRSLGYQARSIVTAQDADNFPDHVVLEVFNPSTNAWEVHDASYDTQYMAQGKPLNVQQMISLGVNNFEPCDFDGRCGWDKISRENIPFSLAERYWSTAWVRRLKTLYVADEFNVEQPRNVDGIKQAYCEKRAKWCNNVVVVK